MRTWNAALSLSLLFVAACSVSSSNGADFSSPGHDASAKKGEPSASGSSSSGGASAAPSAGGRADTPGTAQGSPGAQAGQLTAGVWDDNLNFDFFQKYIEGSGSLGDLPSFSLTERNNAKQKWAQRAGSNELDVAFLVDTTGSMGDELRYLQAEIDDIATTISTKFPSITPRYGLVLYRDIGDAYVTKSFDFGGVADFRARLKEQDVAGGGDFPEAVPEGLEAMLNLSWRSGAVARMAFWVADAPEHSGQGQIVRSRIESAVAKDVHLYPVAASGTDPHAEFTMRTAAQMTGGRYVFLTDDSGIGNDHAEPHIPCYHVTKFNGALVRMVESEMSGTRVAPSPADIIRTVGDPQDGKCLTKTLGPVTIY